MTTGKMSSNDISFDNTLTELQVGNNTNDCECPEIASNTNISVGPNSKKEDDDHSLSRDIAGSYKKPSSQTY